jgi:formamidopyrimidine-DNA glycosylase
MPELPEVEVVRRGLTAYVPGLRIRAVDVLHPRVIRRASEPPEMHLVGARIRHVSRRGKYLWFPLDHTDLAMVAHLGMSGQFRFDSAKVPASPHVRMRLRFDDEDRELRFIDQRTFGWVHVAPLVNDGANGRIPNVVAHVARDPLDPDFDDDAFLAHLRTKQTQIKRALLDQTVISGVGNIYADEGLWRAGIHGRREVANLPRRKLSELLGHIRAVMVEALEQGGTSFDALYVNVNGESGYFDRSLNAYGQAGEPCDRCGAVIRRESFMNRSSFFCPRCQRPPRSV